MPKQENRFRVRETGMTLFLNDLLVRQDISVSPNRLMEATPGDVVTAYQQVGNEAKTLHLKHWGKAEVPEGYVYG